MKARIIAKAAQDSFHAFAVKVSVGGSILDGVVQYVGKAMGSSVDWWRVAYGADAVTITGALSDYLSQIHPHDRDSLVLAIFRSITEIDGEDDAATGTAEMALDHEPPLDVERLAKALWSAAWGDRPSKRWVDVGSTEGERWRTAAREVFRLRREGKL